MARIELFSLRPDERAAYERFLEDWPELDLACHEGDLTEGRLQELGPDLRAVVCCQVRPLSAELINGLAELGCRVLATRSAGYDMYPLELLKKAGIRLVNTPAYSPESIAEFSCMAGLYLLRQMPLIQERVGRGDFRWEPEIMSRRLRDYSVGIAGTGRIGRETARCFARLGCRILAYDLYPDEALEQEGLLRYVSWEELLGQSDLLSLHMPATEENTHILNARSLALMPRGAALVNAARGSLVDTEALLAALDSGALSGAALDTYEAEQPYVAKSWEGRAIESAEFRRLLAHPRLLYTPHIAFYTDEAVEAMFRQPILAAQEILETGKTASEVQL